MAITYSTNLRLTLIGAGDQAGTWGNTTNTNIGTLIEQAIAGYASQTVADSAVSPTSLNIADGTSSTARNMVLVLQGALTGNRDVILPTNQKLYFVTNNTTGGFTVTVKCAGQTGVALPPGAKAILVCNGVDIVEAANYFSGLVFPSSATITTLSGTTLGYGSASITAASIASGTIINLLATTFTGGSASLTTLTGASAKITTISGTSGVITNFNASSATISTLTATSSTIATLKSTSATIDNLTVTSLNASITLPSSATIATLSGTTLGYGSASITNASITALRATTFSGGSASLTTASVASGTVTNLLASTLTATSATITGLSATSAAVGKFTAGSSSVDSLYASGVISVDGAAHTNPVSLTFAASSLTLNCVSSNVFTTVMSGSMTTALVLLNPRDGQTINWFFTQDGTGSRTALWPTSFKWPGGSTGTLSTAAGSVDLLVATYRSATTFWYAALTKGFA